MGGAVNYIPYGSTYKYYNNSSKAIDVKTKFVQINAGYIGYSSNSNGTVKCKANFKDSKNGKNVQSTNTLTMTVFSINNGKLKLTRYSKSGIYTKTADVKFGS